MLLYWILLHHHIQDLLVVQVVCLKLPKNMLMNPTLLLDNKQDLSVHLIQHPTHMLLYWRLQYHHNQYLLVLLVGRYLLPKHMLLYQILLTHNMQVLVELVVCHLLPKHMLMCPRLLSHNIQDLLVHLIQ